MEYSSSFTAGGLLYSEFEAILPYIKQGLEEDFFKKEAAENRHLKLATESARKRVVTEMKKRIAVVGEQFWNRYEQEQPEERRLLLFYLCLKAYQLVWDFHFKVTLPAYRAYHHQLDEHAYKMYLDELESKNEAVQSWSDSTRRKCITNYVRMLKEAGITAGRTILKPDLESDFYRIFIRQNETWMLDAFFAGSREKETILTELQ